eukprot:GHVR01032179.1.p1 GENE.GHVR01032179.1~~GHVR01032179.1.p1  ORF type:complete len:479 (+),score=84.68 GHVR01032179.1:226-1662(+)
MSLDKLDGKVLPTNEESAKKIQRLCKEFTHWQGAYTEFPGSQVVSLSRSNISELMRNLYVVCEKTDGARVLCLIMNKCLYLIDRKYLIKEFNQFKFPLGSDSSKEHHCTLLDGELVDDFLIPQSHVSTSILEPHDKAPTRTRFLIFDVMRVNGLDVCELNLLDRLRILYEELIIPRKNIKYNKRQSESSTNACIGSEPFDIFLKDFYEIWDVEFLDKVCVPSLLPHCNDGLIFTPVKKRYTPGTCAQLIKWKPPHLNSVDFRMLWNSEVGLFRLYCADKGYNVPFDNVWLSPCGGESYTQMHTHHKKLNMRIVECHYDPDGAYFEPICHSALKRNDDNANDDWNVSGNFLPPPSGLTLSIPEPLEPLYLQLRGCWRLGKGGWVPDRVRMDKATPNDRSVVGKVLQSIEDGLKLPDLVKELHIYQTQGRDPLSYRCEMQSYYERPEKKRERAKKSKEIKIKHKSVDVESINNNKRAKKD